MKRSILTLMLLSLAACGYEREPINPDSDDPADTAVIAPDAEVPADDQLHVEEIVVEDAASVGEDSQTPMADSGSPVDAPVVDAGTDMGMMTPPDTGATLVDAGTDSGTPTDTGSTTPDAGRPDGGYDAGMPRDATPEAAAEAAVPECVYSSQCDDGVLATRDICSDGRCTHVTCDDGEPCTQDVGTETECTTTRVPDGTVCRPLGGPQVYTCYQGVCPACGGEGQVCCEWPGSTSVCSGTARCRTTPSGQRRCNTCGGAGERCCEASDGVQWASQRCNSGLSCSSSPGVPGLCR